MAFDFMPQGDSGEVENGHPAPDSEKGLKNGVDKGVSYLYSGAAFRTG